MKIVVFGPFRRTGILHDGKVVDLCRTCAKYLRERANEPNPLELAEVVAPSDLGRLIERGPAALVSAQQALDHLFAGAQDQLGAAGERVVSSPLAREALRRERPPRAQALEPGARALEPERPP